MESVDELLEALDLIGENVLDAGWLPGLRDFELALADGRALIFRDCLQAGLHRPAGAPEPTGIAAWWTDEPSPVLLALDPQIRFLYHHVVFEVGEATLRVAFRELELANEEDENGELDRDGRNGA